MQKPIKIGFIGLGQRGLQHLKELWQLQTEGAAQIVTLVDAFPANLAEAKLQQYIPNIQLDDIVCSTNPAEIVDHPEKHDALYICIPPNVHQGEVIQAAKAGLHLFVEKPMSLYLDEAIDMETAIAESGVLSTVGFQQRFDGRHEAMALFLQDKPPVMAHYAMHAPLEGHNIKHTQTDKLDGPSNRVWTANRAWSGMTMVEGGIHPLDLWRYWLGDVVWVQATYIHRPPEEIIDQADNPYAYAATFGFENGAIGNMTLSRLRRVYHTISEHLVLWNEGQLRLEGNEVAAYHYGGPYPPTGKPETSQIRQLLPTESKNTTYEISKAFLTALIEQKPDIIRSSFSDGMNSLAAVIGANVSDALGGERVYLDELLTHERFAPFRKKEASK